MSQTTRQDLISLVPAADTFVGIDSDGCVFDTMRVKQCQHFHPLIIRHWGLEAIEPQLREVAEFVNLHSRHRGRNRFPALLTVFELLPTRPGVAESGVTLPETRDLRAYCESGLALGNASLAAEVERTGSAELAKILDWSLAVNREIEQNMAPVPPFPAAVASLRKMQGRSDAIVVSQTPEEALAREWRQHGIESLVRAIAGQELGGKADHIRLATDGKYPKHRILLIGDAPGDLAAAREAGVSFYPIQPGDEVASWERFHDAIYDRFLADRYRGELERSVVEAFERSLATELERGGRRA
ncbi:MAG: HAD family hydrolase [Kiritimatiellia bacterium]|jgi:phosphoglycolate phosphatase-like HAD superfamily hydrolase